MQIKLKLGDNVWKHLNTTKTDVSTFEKYKIFINTNYGGFQNAFQVVNRAFDIEFDPKENFFIFSNKLTDELRTSLAAIKRHYNKIDGDKELTADECIDFMGALCVSQKLKENHWEIFRDMTNDFDKLKSANEVVQKAEFYRERLQGASTTSNTFWGKPENKPKIETKSNLNNLNLTDKNFRAYCERYNPNYSSNYKQIKINRTWSDKNFREKKVEAGKPQRDTDTLLTDNNETNSSFISILDKTSLFH